MPLGFAYYFALGDDIKIIYAPSEKYARIKFKKAFNVEAGALLKRTIW